jgi:hypothetical protein
VKVQGGSNLCADNLFGEVDRVDAAAVEMDIIPGIRASRARREDHEYWQREVHTDTFLLVCTGEEIGDSFMNRIIHLTGSTVEIALEDFFFVFSLYPKVKIALADRATEDIHE